MNFFERRRILKNISFTDLTPVRLHPHETNDEERVDLLVPKFRSKILRRFLIPGIKKDHFRIRLDELGSHVWLEMDGRKTTSQICHALISKQGEKFQPHEQVQQRVMKFISQLYHQRFLTFKEIMD
jgi:hypothetical protein